MDLYSLATAAIPRRDSPYTLNVSCYAVCVTDMRRRELKIIDNLSFETSINYRDAPGCANITKSYEAIDCFERIVGTVEELTERQKRSLEANGHPYIEMPLYIGQASAHPVNQKSILDTLFSPDIDFVPPRVFTDAEIEAKKIEKRNLPTPQGGGVHIKHLFLWEDIDCNEIRKKDAAALVAEGPKIERYIGKFKSACARLSKLIDLCTLEWGSFSGDNSSRGLNPSELDIKLSELKPRLGTDPAVLDELIEIAKAEGRGFGYDGSSSIFSLMAPKGYWEDQQMRMKFPRFSYYSWDPRIEAAFYEGFAETHDGKRFKHLKLPTEAPNKFFTDPAADLICEVFQVAYGQRARDTLQDDEKGRSIIKSYAENVKIEKSQNYFAAPR
jgi:hypothetical protein